jgi:hypothetical protein
MKHTASQKPSQQTLVKKAKDWIASEGGREAVLEALREAEEMTAQLIQARQVDPKSLHEPATV